MFVFKLIVFTMYVKSVFYLCLSHKMAVWICACSIPY